MDYLAQQIGMLPTGMLPKKAATTKYLATEG
jgi:hypothetical protein